MLALRTGGGNSILGRLGDQAPLEMRRRSVDMKNQLAGGRVRVDPFLQAEQGNAALLEHGDSRMATYTSLKRINAVPIRGSEIEIDRADVDSEGMTEIGFSGLIAVL